MRKAAPPAPKAKQLLNQCRTTMAMLPYASVGGLFAIDIEVLVAIFGQAMRILNELPDLEQFTVDETFRKAETQREYWRRKQREWRERKRTELDHARDN